MLFMCIYTYEPKERAAVVKRRVEKGAMAPPGVKIVSEWSALAGGRAFRLVESDDPMAMADATAAWADLGKLEIFPVVEMEERIKYVSSK